ncbi:MULTISPECIES: FMN reductase [Streptomyces]|uniref:NADPH-dependent FMN reductase n=1 Tax=Streptomyces dengpaensis TaxID=2049881 RepID=A0ABN5HXB3_9ACTN|nr:MULTISPECIES: FMN reductase [Streptomyces]AVH55752.1 NADPH-dependent FMN reductase [Streptomyces dengpaensis]PIB12011.1 NADPH-dependent FMN reductase [Streptomyces sp. HG99]
MKRTLTVVSAGLRLPSSTRMLADRLADAARKELEIRGTQVDVSVIEVRDHAHDLVNNLTAGYPTPELRHVFDTVAQADGLIAVTPTFTASYNGLFKMFFDCLEDTALVNKPVLIAATGGTGRHSLVLEHALRPMFAYLHAVIMPTAVFAGPEDWGSGDTSQEPLVRRIEQAAGELAGEVSRRETPTINDPYAAPVPFERLLHGD